MNTTTTSATPRNTTKMSNPFARGAMLAGKRIEHWKAINPINDTALEKPLHWTKKPRHVVLVGDLFHENVPDEWIDRVFAVMALCPQHIFQVLTKRADRMRAYLISRNGMGNGNICRAINEIPASMGNRHGALSMPLPNCWLGTSVEDQKHADERIPLLLDTPAAIRWISAEPLLGPIDFDGMWIDHPDPGMHVNMLERLDWVVAGGESRQNKPGRPAHPDWFRSLRDQCQAAGVAFHFGQWGDWCPGENVGHPATRTEETATWGNEGWDFDSLTRRQSEELHRDDEPDLYRVGAKHAGRLLDGREWLEYPEAGR